MSKEIEKNVIKELIKEAKKQKQAFDEATVKCGIIGMSGAGKSSFINAIVGEKIAEVGSTEQTMEAQSFHHMGLEFVDLPGCGTEKWPKDTYIKKLKLDTYDCFIIVTSNRLYENDIYLYEELSLKQNKPCFVVRNKIDLAIVDEKRDNGLDEKETLKKVKKDILSHINDLDKVYLISTIEPEKWDFSDLLKDISESQKGVKQDKFIAGMAIWSEKALYDKKNIAYKIVSWSAVTSAANGLNPIPGTDIAIDATILINMVKKINSIFGLTEEQLKYIERMAPSISNTPEFNGIKQGVIKFIAKYITTEGILIVLKRMSTRVAIKNISKFLPFIGNIISAGIGYKMTTSFGESYIDEAEEKAKLLLDSLLKNKIVA